MFGMAFQREDSSRLYTTLLHVDHVPYRELQPWSNNDDDAEKKGLEMGCTFREGSLREIDVEFWNSRGRVDGDEVNRLFLCLGLRAEWRITHMYLLLEAVERLTSVRVGLHET